MNNRDKFSSKTGLLLTCVGAAVGLGNIWMFPWRLAQYGGAAFLIPYLLFVYLLGTTGLMGEFSLGRWAGKGPIGAFDKILKEKGYGFGKILGLYPVVVSWGVLIFYSIVSGWILHYLYTSINGTMFNISDFNLYFDQFAGHSESIIWTILVIGIVLVVTIWGISKGIEKANKFMMPALFFIFFILMIRSITFDGAFEGIKYLLIPDWSFLLKPVTWGMALGQAFFTVSLSGAGMVVYGSYIKKDFDIPNLAIKTVTLDTLAAILAALLIIPSVFAFDLNPNAGPPLLFITIPKLFNSIPGGNFFGILFFISVLFAALSTLFSLKEIIVEAMIDNFSLNRKVSIVITCIITILLGIPFALDMRLFLNFVDIITIYFAPLGAVLAAVLFYWVFTIKRARDEINIGAKNPIGKWWEPVAKYIFVSIAILIVFLQILFHIG